LSAGPSSPPTARHAELLALAGELRPELHRYCARLMGSVIEGEDMAQDTFARAFVALDGTNGQISFIRDYRYVRYVVDDAELVLAPGAAPPGEGTAHG
jgi:DNA-directed RNA polymerase specialized sigma24 family protein